MSRTHAGADTEVGSVSLVLPLLTWVATLAAIALIDVGGYLVAASRAQSLADAAALAAVSADATPFPARTPRAEAERVVAAGAGRLESCSCPAGRGQATVTVSVEVPGLVLPRLGTDRLTADASATLVGAA